MTKNGKIILGIIEEETCHPTAEDVYNIVQDKNYSMSLATVYNNLNSLCADGSIRRISIQNQIDRYDKIKPHDHLICKRCGMVKDVYLKNRKNELEKETGVEINNYDLQLYYVCKSCEEEPA